MSAHRNPEPRGVDVDDRDAETGRRKNPVWVLVAACAATGALLVNVTSVYSVIPELSAALGAGFADVQWVIDAYALALAALLLPAGSAADRLGRRRVFVTGLLVFAAASLGCGLAPDTPALIGARAVQGVGAAVLLSTSLALLNQEFSGRARARAFGIWGATLGAAVALGPLAGGALSEWFGWEWAFWINIPVAVATIAVAVTRRGESRDPEAGGIDWPGTVAFAAALFALVLALTQANTSGWESPLVLMCFTGAVGAGAVFVAVELRRERPMLQLELFRSPAFCGVSLAAFAIGASALTMLLYNTLFFQDVLGYSPLQAGLRLLPQTATTLLAAPLAGRLAPRIPLRLALFAGLALAGTGMLLMRGLHAGSPWTALVPGLVVAGAGTGLTNPTLASASTAILPRARGGMASGINNTFRQAGIAGGIAVLGAVLHASVSGGLHRALDGHAGSVNPRTVQLVASGQLHQAAAATSPTARANLVHAAPGVFVSGLNGVFLVGAMIAFAGAALAFILARGTAARVREVRETSELSESTPK